MPEPEDGWAKLRTTTLALDDAVWSLANFTVVVRSTNPDLRIQLDSVNAGCRVASDACKSAKESLSVRARLHKSVSDAENHAKETEADDTAAAKTHAADAAQKEAAAATARATVDNLIRARAHVSAGVLDALETALLNVKAVEPRAQDTFKRLTGVQARYFSDRWDKTKSASTALRDLVDDRRELEASLRELLRVAAREEENRDWYPVDPEMVKVRAADLAPSEMTRPAHVAEKAEPTKPEDQTYEALVKQLLARIAVK
jgi:hypothetical protein